MKKKNQNRQNSDNRDDTKNKITTNKQAGRKQKSANYIHTGIR